MKENKETNKQTHTNRSNFNHWCHTLNGSYCHILPKSSKSFTLRIFPPLRGRCLTNMLPFHDQVLAIFQAFQLFLHVANNLSAFFVRCSFIILLALLFLLYVNYIQNCAPDFCIKLFADDTNIFVTGKSLEETINKANNNLL